MVIIINDVSMEHMVEIDDDDDEKGNDLFCVLPHN